ncbi:uncharacterized protein LOC130823669 [Amaranthus tricolor]|uniref:uncharacterized protein LOC130823669 n=1 Tax=Amaranthus tricolor TaxID=29722 RepID=UPI0025825D9C|nr:uncharacterized protein LOC130823669 [Amaranthus tricolor]
MANLFKRKNNNMSYAYTKIEKEDPEERNHREAQFLIYKTLKQADQVIIRRSSSSSKSSCWLRLRISKLKVKIGKRLFKLKKTMLSNMAKTKMCVYKQLLGHLKTIKSLFRVGNGGGGSTSAVIDNLPQLLIN